MKKFLLAVMLLAQSAFAITLAEIDLGTHPRAYILDVANYEPGVAYKLTYDGVVYPYWTASYPYDGLKYSGEVSPWYYTEDFTNYYFYSSYWDQFNFSYTLVYVDLNGYSQSNLEFYYTRNGQTSQFQPNLQLDNGSIYYFIHTDSAGVSSYFVQTNIQAEDGTAQLGNTVTLDPQ